MIETSETGKALMGLVFQAFSPSKEERLVSEISGRTFFPFSPMVLCSGGVLSCLLSSMFISEAVGGVGSSLLGAVHNLLGEGRRIMLNLEHRDTFKI